MRAFQLISGGAPKGFHLNAVDANGQPTALQAPCAWSLDNPGIVSIVADNDHCTVQPGPAAGKCQLTATSGALNDVIEIDVVMPPATVSIQPD